MADSIAKEEEAINAKAESDLQDIKSQIAEKRKKIEDLKVDLTKSAERLKKTEAEADQEILTYHELKRKR